MLKTRVLSTAVPLHEAAFWLAAVAHTTCKHPAASLHVHVKMYATSINRARFYLALQAHTYMHACKMQAPAQRSQPFREVDDSLMERRSGRFAALVAVVLVALYPWGRFRGVTTVC